MRGRNKPWAKDFIAAHQDLIFDKEKKYDKPLTLEVGIGKGDFIVQNASFNKDYLHVGVEINESIFAIAMKKIVNMGIDNIKMLNIKAADLLNYTNENSFSKIYLNFSDPWPQNGYRKRRLVHPIHLEIFEKIIIDKGMILFKTDNQQLFEMAKRNFETRNYQIISISDNYQTEDGDFVSEYESRFRSQGLPIYRIVAIIDKTKFKPWGETYK